MIESEPPADPALDLRALAAEQADPEARARLAQGVYRVVRRYCRARLSRSPADHALADDVAATITAGILRDHGDELRGPAPVEAVVYVDMAAGVGLVLGRGSARPRRSPHTVGSAADPARTPELTLDALDRLPPRPREVLVLRALVGLTSEQVGRAMGLSTETVRREQQSALSRLRERT